MYIYILYSFADLMKDHLADTEIVMMSFVTSVLN